MSTSFGWVTINPHSSVPPYEQLRLRLAEAAASGRLVAGTKLPTVRALAEQLGLAVNTVAKAYRELERAGIVSTRSRAGTVVSASGSETKHKVAEAAAAYAAVVMAHGVSAKEAESYLQAALEALR